MEEAEHPHSLGWNSSGHVLYKVKMLSTWSFGAFSIRQTLPGVVGGFFI